MPSGTDIRVATARRRPFALITTRAIALVGAGLAISVMAVLIDTLVADPDFVDRITVQNNSEYDVHIAFGPASGESLLPVGTAIQHCATTFDLVIDQGETWLVRFRTQRREANPIVISRTDLENSDWRVTIPDSIRDDFARTGAPPPPTQACST